MLTLKEIQILLGDRNLAEVSRRTGITRAYLSALRTGEKSNPTYNVIYKLDKYLNDENHK